MFNSPRILVLFTILLWSFGSLVSRLIAIQSQFVLLSISFFFTFITILIYLLLSKDFSLTKLRKIPLAYLLVGPLGYFVYSVAYIQSSRSFNSISETTLLNNTWPIFTVIFSDLLFNRIKKTRSIQIIDGLGILIGFLAIFILVTDGNLNAIHMDFGGLIWGLVTGISYGIYGAYSGTIKSEDQKYFLFVGITISLLLIVFPAIREIKQVKPLSLQDILAAFSLGALLDGFGYIFWTRAIRLSKEKKIRISTVASLMFVLPFLNLFIVKLTLGENQLTKPSFFVSLLLLVLSTVIVQRADDISSLATTFRRSVRS